MKLNNNYFFIIPTKSIIIIVPLGILKRKSDLIISKSNYNFNLI